MKRYNIKYYNVKSNFFKELYIGSILLDNAIDLTIFRESYERS